MADANHDRDGDGSAGFHLGYRPWLDGVRGLAILIVLAGHLRLVSGGFLGVDIFFVLSGFLITSLLVEEWELRRSISLKRFYVRRALRLLPAFYTLLLICYLSTRFFRPEELVTFRQEMIVAACYVANWPTLHQTILPTLGHTWSLSLEEQFYLLWPLILYGLLRSGISRGRILLLVCAGIIGSAALRIALYRLNHDAGLENLFNVIRLYSGLDTRADALLTGCLVGLLATWELLPKTRGFLILMRAGSVASVAGLGYMVFHSCLEHAPFYYGLFTLVALLVAVVLVRSLSAPLGLVSLVLEFPPLVGIGRISYALYLFHVPIIHWLRPAGLGWRFPGQTLLAASLSITAAVISYYGIERPCLRLKQRLRVAEASPGPPGSARGDDTTTSECTSSQAAA
jgi:peptidoglycan/LPS O-acetylase OafA/YrhL